jgi:hypothetical protein
MVLNIYTPKPWTRFHRRTRVVVRRHHLWSHCRGDVSLVVGHHHWRAVRSVGVRSSVSQGATAGLASGLHRCDSALLLSAIARRPRSHDPTPPGGKCPCRSRRGRGRLVGCHVSARGLVPLGRSTRRAPANPCRPAPSGRPVCADGRRRRRCVACARRAMLILAGAFPINVRRPWTWIG